MRVQKPEGKNKTNLFDFQLLFMTLFFSFGLMCFTIEDEA